MIASHNRLRLARAASVALLAMCVAFAACGGKTPTSPSPVSPQPATPPAGSAQTEVRLVDATSGAAISGVTATIDSRTMAASDGAGLAVVWASQPGQYTVIFSAGSTVSRTTSIKVPASETSVSMIPASFDLAAFNEMFRASQRLQRWTSAPPLVILTRAVQYEGNYANDPVVLEDELTENEQQVLLTDLSDGFVTLTDRQLGGFSSVTFESPEPGSRVNVMRTGVILVARSKGLTAGSTYWGYGRWATNSAGAVLGGNVMIDADFDGPSGAWPEFRRSLRIHELGHALGYNHVTLRASVMNSSARLEPNAWDLQAVHIAFQRVPGNTSPDNDPSSFSLNVRTGAITWGPPIY